MRCWRGADVTELARQAGVHRATVHRRVARYLTDQLGRLMDRSNRPQSCPHQVPPTVEVAVAEMRRRHPRWGSRRIRLELLRSPSPNLLVPGGRTIDRILIRQGLLRARPQKRPRGSFRRFEGPGPMQLWGSDIVGGVQLIDQRTGKVRETKLVTGSTTTRAEHCGCLEERTLDQIFDPAGPAARSIAQATPQESFRPPRTNLPLGARPICLGGAEDWTQRQARAQSTGQPS